MTTCVTRHSSKIKLFLWYNLGRLETRIKSEVLEVAMMYCVCAITKGLRKS